MIFADPPFNISHGYKGFDDNLSENQYFDFTDAWINACWSKLKPGGAMILHGSPTVANTMFVSLFASQISYCIETELIWSYNFGQCQFGNFIQTHCRSIVVRKPGEPRKWYVENVLTESKRLLMGDKRCEESRYKGYIPFGTVWGLDDVDGVIVEPVTAQPNWGRVQGNNKERRHGHPNQLPERYVERIIQAYTEPNDLIFDPFLGSGTTIVVAKHLNRNCIGTDISEWNCESIKSRLNEGAKL
jgi:site-specific DNA-methyltransferase (adenine-specific)